MSAGDGNWRNSLLNKIRDRNKIESAYHKVIHQNNRLLDAVSQLESEKLKISVENDQLRTAVATGGNGKNSGGSNLIATLEKKLLTQQEELTQLHKRKGENSQLIVDLNVKVEKLNNMLSERDKRLSESVAINNSLKAEVQMLNSSMEELKKLDTTLRDEHTALALAFSSLEEKLRKVQDENHSLLDRLMQYKSKDADKLNEENDSFIRKRSDKVRQDLQDAVRESRTSPSHLPPAGDYYEDVGIDLINDDLYGGPSTNLRLEINYPSTILSNFEAHDGEVSAVRWSPVDRVLATGGADRKVKLWDAEKRSTEPCGVLTGSSAGINSVDFDSSGCYIIGTSNDYAARIWTVADHRLRHSLTAHSGKVMAAKYIQEPSKVVTGSHDRTLKIWDLRYGSCVETKFAGSSCNDLVTTDSLGSTIISGHYDKKIRFWDIRTEKYTKDVLMTGKITSLDITKDSNFLLSSGRDDTIKLLDLRMNNIITTYEHENFKLNCDWARAGFSFNGNRVACGSSDGSIFIWNICGKLETILKGHNPFAVNAVDWSQTNSTLASVGKNRRCIVWVSS